MRKEIMTYECICDVCSKTVNESKFISNIPVAFGNDEYAFDDCLDMCDNCYKKYRTSIISLLTKSRYNEILENGGK